MNKYAVHTACGSGPIGQRSGIMKKAQTSKKKKRNLFLRIAVLVFAVYIIVTLIQLQLTINDKQSEINETSEAITDKQRENDDLQHKLDNPDQYLDQQARDQGYVHPGDDVYKEIP